MKTTNYNNNYGFKLNEVVFTGEVGTRTDSPTLPGTEGQITLSKFAATNNGAPTVDLYFTGNIQKTSMQIFPRQDYDVPSPSIVYMPTPDYDFYSNSGVFPINKVKLTWGRGSGSVSFSPSTFHSDITGGTYTYRYTGDKISFTTNWNNEYHDSGNVSPDTPIEFNGPSVDVTTIPTVYCNWEVIWDYPCTCHIDCSIFCTAHCNTKGDGGYIEWDTIHYTGYYGLIRVSPSFDAEVVPVMPINDEVTVSGRSGDWYYVTFKNVQTDSPRSGWCNADGLDTSKDPNSGGGDECPNFNECLTYCGHVCNHSCSHSCEGYIYCGRHSD